jgi:hypothetical protein
VTGQGSTVTNEKVVVELSLSSLGGITRERILDVAEDISRR